MTAAHPHVLQDTFLEHVRKHDVPVTVFLANGIRLQGIVAGFDSYALLLVRDQQSQPSISTQSQPSCPVSRIEWLRSLTAKGPLKT